MVYPRLLDVGTDAFITALGIDKQKRCGLYGWCLKLHGIHTGAQQQLREKLCPYIVGVHCTAHRTASVMNDAGKGNHCLQTVGSLLKLCTVCSAKAKRGSKSGIDFASKRHQALRISFKLKKWLVGPGMTFKVRKCSLLVLQAEMRKLAGIIILKSKERCESSKLLGHFHIFPSFYFGMPIQNLERFGWESFKVLLALFCGKERGSMKLFEFGGAIITNEFMMMKKGMHEVVNQSKILDPVHVGHCCGGDHKLPFS
eukprot:1159953-Pelagomonas_calceolata.AAC.1